MKVTYNKFWFALILLCTILASLNSYAQSGKEKYNVLFIAVDDLNDWISPLGGYPGIITPNLEKLANKGVSFKKAYCSAPACNPSRASLMTGVRPSSSGVYHNDQPWKPVLKDVVTLPQYFTANGYEVQGIGKIYHDTYDDKSSWPVRYVVLPSPKPDGAPVYGKAHFDWSPVNAKDEEMGDYKNVDLGIEFLRKKHDKPFFLALGFTRPHLPWYAPQKYFDLYPLSNIVLPKVQENDLADIPEAGRKIAKPNGDHKFIKDSGEWKKAVQGYLASITFTDGQVGRIIDALSQSEHKDNTVIVLFGDHGWHLGEKEHWRKFALWEEATRVPFIIVAPGVSKTGVSSDRTVNLMDIYPTLVELCKLPAKKGLEGNSVVPLLKNPTQTWKFPSVTTHGLENHSVRSDRWRYIRYKDGSEELYDHDSDPQEWRNLAKDTKYASVKRELAKSLPKVNAPDAPQETKGSKQD
jgi:arylsulfatase A-like enzyme